MAFNWPLILALVIAIAVMLILEKRFPDKDRNTTSKPTPMIIDDP